MTRLRGADLRPNRTQLLGLLVLVTILIAITVARYLWLLLARGG